MQIKSKFFKFLLNNIKAPPTETSLHSGILKYITMHRKKKKRLNLVHIVFNTVLLTCPWVRLRYRIKGTTKHPRRALKKKHNIPVDLYLGFGVHSVVVLFKVLLHVSRSLALGHQLPKAEFTERRSILFHDGV